jgi:DNA mismatch endonuclease (patch repair protein)
MRAIRSKDMLPELMVRRAAHRLGYRFRLHRKDLPGNPDIVFATRHKVIFVHGCFWHSHNCKIAHTPKSNQAYWIPKLERNRTRDGNNLEALKIAGWKVMIVWECETRDQQRLEKALIKFLGEGKVNGR